MPTTPMTRSENVRYVIHRNNSDRRYDIYKRTGFAEEYTGHFFYDLKEAQKYVNDMNGILGA